MQVKKQRLELDMEQWSGSKLGREYIKAVYMHIYSVYVQKTSSEMPDESQAGIKTARSSINNLRYADNTTLNGERGTKEPLDEGERGEWKSCLKTQY